MTAGTNQPETVSKLLDDARERWAAATIATICANRYRRRPAGA